MFLFICLYGAASPMLKSWDGHFTRNLMLKLIIHQGSAP